MKVMDSRYAASVLLILMGFGPETRARQDSKSPVSQPASSAIERVIGDVAAMDPANGRISLRTDSGKVTVVLTGGAEFLRVAPGESSLGNAARIDAAELAPGDRVFAQGKLHDPDTVAATRIIVMKRVDILERNRQENLDWQRRGVAGVVIAVNPASREITILPRGRADASPVVIKVTEGTRFRRYAGGSVKFADAKPGSFADLRPGDQLRALGQNLNTSPLTVDEIVSGTFLILAGVVSSINTATGEIKITVAGLNQPATVRVTRQSIVRRITAAAAAALVREHNRQKSSAGPGDTEPSSTGASRDPDLLELIPVIPVTELRQGDLIAISSPAVQDQTRLTALTVVAGIDTLVSVLQKQGGFTGPGLNTGLPAGLLDLVTAQP
jgi:hypothetical protein